MFMADREPRRIGRRGVVQGLAITGLVLATGVGVLGTIRTNNGGDAEEEVKKGPLVAKGKITVSSSEIKAAVQSLSVDIPRIGLEGGQEDFAAGHWGNDEYIKKGVDFRGAKKILKNRLDPNFARLDDLYSVLRDAHDGREYLRNGEVFDPKIGDVFYIQDPWGGPDPGVFLRSDPHKDPYAAGDGKFVFHGMTVGITGGAVEALDAIGGQNAFFFPVIVVDERWDMVTDIKASKGATGWISRNWFGDKAGVLDTLPTKSSPLTGK